jgi:hypothetical protein
MSMNNGQTPQQQLTCLFCGKSAPVESAVDGGWVPSFWHNGVEYGKPGKAICPDCVAAHLTFNEECGDYELLPDHALPPWDEKEGN